MLKVIKGRKHEIDDKILGNFPVEVILISILTRIEEPYRSG
jgi:hypothetical protein